MSVDHNMFFVGTLFVVVAVVVVVDPACAFFFDVGRPSGPCLFPIAVNFTDSF